MNHRLLRVPGMDYVGHVGHSK